MVRHGWLDGIRHEWLDCCFSDSGGQIDRSGRSSEVPGACFVHLGSLLVMEQANGLVDGMA